MKHDHNSFHVSKSSEDQKNTFSPKIAEFLSPKASEDQKKVQRSSSAQMQTIVKLLGGCSQIIGGIYPTPSGFGTPVQCDMNVIISKTDSRHINGASKLGAKQLDYVIDGQVNAKR